MSSMFKQIVSRGETLTADLTSSFYDHHLKNSTVEFSVKSEMVQKPYTPFEATASKDTFGF